MMNVLHLTTHVNTGGITTYIKKLVKPLRALGIESHILSSGGEEAAFLRETGAKTFELPIKTKNELHLKLYLALIPCLKIIRKNKIQILHAHTRVTQVLAYWLHQLTGIPVVTTCHGFYKRRLGRRLIPAWGQKVIAISDAVLEHLTRDFKVSREHIAVINNGVDLEEIDSAYAQHDPGKVKEVYGIKKEAPVIGIVARIVRDKGHAYLLQALPVLRKKFPDIKALIVGAGNYRTSLEALVKDLGIQNHVIFTGNERDVTYPISAMDIFVLPAIWREGFGLSIIEAMACRKPIIVTNIWSLNSLIQNGRTGLLIEPKQIEPLVHAITDYLENEELRQRIAENGRKMVEELFSIHRMALEIKQTYLEVLNGKRGRVPTTSYS